MFPNEIIESGNIKWDSLLHPEKLELFRKSSEEGMVIWVKLEHWKKQKDPIDKIVFDMGIFVRFVQNSKQKLPNFFIDSGIVIESILKLLKHLIPNSKIIGSTTTIFCSMFTSKIFKRVVNKLSERISIVLTLWSKFLNSRGKVKEINNLTLKFSPWIGICFFRKRKL